MELLTRKAFSNYIIKKQDILDHAIGMDAFDDYVKVLPKIPKALQHLIIDIRDYGQSQTESEEWRVRGIIDLILAFYTFLPETPIVEDKGEKGSLNNAYFLLHYLLNDPKISSKLGEWDILTDITEVANTLQTHLPKKRKVRAKAKGTVPINEIRKVTRNLKSKRQQNSDTL